MKVEVYNGYKNKIYCIISYCYTENINNSINLTYKSFFNDKINKEMDSYVNNFINTNTSDFTCIMFWKMSKLITMRINNSLKCNEYINELYNEY